MRKRRRMKLLKWRREWSFIATIWVCLSCERVLVCRISSKILAIYSHHVVLHYRGETDDHVYQSWSFISKKQVPLYCRSQLFWIVWRYAFFHSYAKLHNITQTNADFPFSTVSGCRPQIPDLDVLVQELNETNDLSSFVRTMRKKFKQLCSART